MSSEKIPFSFGEDEDKNEKTDSLLDNFENYKEARRKEVKKELTEEQFSELLSFEFKKFVAGNPLIEGVFSPEEEIQEVLELSNEEKKAKLGEFREKLRKQKEAWANCRIFIERYIEFNNDVPKNYLLNLVEQFGEYYGFTEEQKKDAEHLMDIYYQKRQDALDIRERFPDDLDLIEELTGVRFDDSSEFEVKVGPASVDIQTNSENVTLVDQRARGVEIEEEENERDEEILVKGFFRISRTHPPVYYTVLSTSGGFRELQKVDVHEQQHIKNRIVSNIFEEDIPEIEKDYLIVGLNKENDSDERERILDRYLDMKMSEALDRVKDEIISLSISGHSIEDHGVFDFEEKIKIREDLLRSDKERGLKDLYLEKYGEVLKEGVEAFGKLVSLGYSKKEAVYLLADKDLRKWPKTVKRISG
ncbi:MAG: hypothetical protein ACQESA_00245 [Patescibacteria group bacterium]